MYHLLIPRHNCNLFEHYSLTPYGMISVAQLGSCVDKGNIFTASRLVTIQGQKYTDIIIVESPVYTM